jgi:hypothetical protein
VGTTDSEGYNRYQRSRFGPLVLSEVDDQKNAKTPAEPRRQRLGSKSLFIAYLVRRRRGDSPGFFSRTKLVLDFGGTSLGLNVKRGEFAGLAHNLYELSPLIRISLIYQVKLAEFKALCAVGQPLIFVG